jgi:hypothetical protein
MRLEPARAIVTEQQADWDIISLFNWSHPARRSLAETSTKMDWSNSKLCVVSCRERLHMVKLDVAQEASVAACVGEGWMSI